MEADSTDADGMDAELAPPDSGGAVTGGTSAVPSPARSAGDGGVAADAAGTDGDGMDADSTDADGTDADVTGAV
jgi:hypothetical protein